MAEAVPGRSRRRAAPGLVFLTIGVGLMVLLGVMTLTAAQTPPPAIAELSPEAVQQITNAPADQAATSGPGGAGVGPTTSITTTTAASTSDPSAAGEPTSAVARIEQARVRRCVGSPPRQTEDPQSPPCVPFWSGDNGGATARGVTAQEVKVVATGGGANTVPIFESFINKRFEFYGRRVTITRVGSGDATCASQKAAAAEVQKAQAAFAVIESSDATKACFHKELARRGVVNALTVPHMTEPEMVALHPNMWQYLMAEDRGFAGIAAMICARLKGGNAAHSGDPFYRQAPRRFGIIVQERERDVPTDVAPIERGLAACGLRSEITLRGKATANAEAIAFSEDAVLQLRSRNVSTTVCVCNLFIEQFISAAATNQGYFPEWVLSSYYANDANGTVKLFWTSEQRKSIIGMTSGPPMRAARHEPAIGAAVEMGTSEVDAKRLDQLFNVYRSMLLLASGIQMAGPNLTPASFGSGLQRTRFPYPPTDPTRSGDVGFTDRDHSMTNDFAEAWWSEADRSPDMYATYSAGDPGTFCYLDGARRTTIGAWRTGDHFFRAPCVSDGAHA